MIIIAWFSFKAGTLGSTSASFSICIGSPFAFSFSLSLSLSFSLDFSFSFSFSFSLSLSFSSFSGSSNFVGELGSSLDFLFNLERIGFNPLGLAVNVGWIVLFFQWY